MFIFTCRIFARQLVFPAPQTTTDSSKRLLQVVHPDKQHPTPPKVWLRLCWVELPFNGANQVGGWQCCYKNFVVMVTCWIFIWSAHISVICPLSIPKEHNLSLLHQCPGQLPPCFSHLPPLHPHRIHPVPQHQCPGQLSYKWAKGMVMSPCWASSYLFNFWIETYIISTWPLPPFVHTEHN
jgi:hypothetical protein